MEGADQAHLQAPLRRTSTDGSDSHGHTGERPHAARSTRAMSGSPLDTASTKLDAALEAIIKVRNRQSQQLASAGALNGGAADGRASSSIHGSSAGGPWSVTRKSSVASSTSSRLPAAADPDYIPPQERGAMLPDAGPNSLAAAGAHVPNGRIAMARSKSRQGLANDGAPAMPPPAALPVNSAAVAVASSQTEAPRSSTDWSERGASRHMEHVVVNGHAQARMVKKGVRDFNFGRTLGEGSYSTVVAATDKQTLKEYAIKVLDKRHIIKEKKVKYVNIEKDTLFRLVDHPGIVRLYYTFQDEASLYFVLDLAPNGELLGILKRLGSFDLPCTRYYGAQILDAIGYMHTQGVIHRDLKPENVLLDQHMRVKIADFGTAKLLDLPGATSRDSADGGERHGHPDVAEKSDRSNSFVGTAEYVSPELLTEKSTCKASDLWAFGCIVFQMLAGRPPFKAGNEYQTFQKIVHLDYSYPPGFPPDAQDLVTLLLVRETAQRLGLAAAKQHEFFHSIDWSSLWQVKAPQLRAYRPPPMVLDAKPDVPQHDKINHAAMQSSAASSIADEHVAPVHDGSDQQSGGTASAADRPQHSSASRVPASRQSNQSSGQSTAAEHHLSSKQDAAAAVLAPPSIIDHYFSRVIDIRRERVTHIDRLQVLSSTSEAPPRKFNRLLHRRKHRHLLVTNIGRCLLLELPSTSEAALHSATTSTRDIATSTGTNAAKAQQIAATVKADIDLSASDTTIRPSSSSTTSTAASTSGGVGGVGDSAGGGGEGDSKSFVLETAHKSWLCTCRDARRALEWRRCLHAAKERAIDAKSRHPQRQPRPEQSLPGQTKDQMQMQRPQQAMRRQPLSGHGDDRPRSSARP